MSSFYQELGAIEDDRQEKKRQEVKAERLNACGHDRQLRLEQPRPKSAAKRPKCEPEIVNEARVSPASVSVSEETRTIANIGAAAA